MVVVEELTTRLKDTPNFIKFARDMSSSIERALLERAHRSFAQTSNTQTKVDLLIDDAAAASVALLRKWPTQSSQLIVRERDVAS